MVDLLRAARLGYRMWPAVITSGHGETMAGEYYGLPKRDLIVGLQVMLQRKELQIAAGLEAGPELVREMAEMRVKVTATGHEQFGAWREGQHDDLVFAVALACWGVKKVHGAKAGGEVGWWVRE